MKLTVRALGHDILDIELTAHPDHAAPTLEASGHTDTERADPETVTVGFAPGWAAGPTRRSQSEPDPSPRVPRTPGRLTGQLTAKLPP